MNPVDLEAERAALMQTSRDWARAAAFLDPAGVTQLQNGKGVTVWRKDPDGAWKCVIDIWNNNPAERALPSIAGSS